MKNIYKSTQKFNRDFTSERNLELLQLKCFSFSTPKVSALSFRQDGAPSVMYGCLVLSQNIKHKKIHAATML